MFQNFLNWEKLPPSNWSKFFFNSDEVSHLSTTFSAFIFLFCFSNCSVINRLVRFLFIVFSPPSIRCSSLYRAVSTQVCITRYRRERKRVYIYKRNEKKRGEKAQCNEQRRRRRRALSVGAPPAPPVGLHPPSIARQTRLPPRQPGRPLGACDVSRRRCRVFVFYLFLFCHISLGDDKIRRYGLCFDNSRRDMCFAIITY